MDEIPVTNMVPETKTKNRKLTIAVVAALAVLAVLVFTIISRPASFSLTIGVGENNKSAGMEADSMVAMGLWNEYVAGDTLSKSAGSDAVYKADLMRAQDLTTVLTVAFDVKGNVSESKDSTFYSLTKGEIDESITDYEAYKGEFLNIYGSAQNGLLTWNVYDVSANTVSVSTESPDSRTKHVNTTTEEVIKAESERIMELIGYNLNEYKTDIQYDTFTAILQLNGEDTPSYLQFSFFKGKIISATGTNVLGFKKVADAPVVSEYDGVEKLNDFRWYAMPPIDLNQPAIAYGAAMTKDAAAADCIDPENCNDILVVEGEVTVGSEGESTEPSMGGGTEPVEPMPVDGGEPVPSPSEGVIAPAPEEPTKTVITITSAKKAWVMVEAADGSSYLVRGWMYYTEDSKEYSVGAVIALPDGVIKFKEVDMIPMGRD